MPYAMTAALIICTLSYTLFALAGYKAFYLGESTSVSKTCGSTASQSKQCIPWATVTCVICCLHRFGSCVPRPALGVGPEGAPGKRVPRR